MKLLWREFAPLPSVRLICQLKHTNRKVLLPPPTPVDPASLFTLDGLKGGPSRGLREGVLLFVWSHHLRMICRFLIHSVVTSSSGSLYGTSQARGMVTGGPRWGGL
jgi:hypothetical protein